MTWFEHGRVKDGAIVLPRPLPLPEGTEVTVRIEAVAAGKPAMAAGETTSTPFFGMWSDRQDLADSAAWIRKERAQWPQRSSRQD
jgi:hypothetical protein